MQNVSHFNYCTFMIQVIALHVALERFSIECRKAKPTLSLWPITKDTHNPVNQSKLEANACSRHKARENVCERVIIGFGFTSNWLRKWREFFKPITNCLNAEPTQTQITFDTRVKSALTTLYETFSHVFIVT